ncbi:MAG: hypothetical protein LBS96_07745 [Oscillospiraceae bacterium]|jgi:alpha-mannosidase|nr:hypothetical protein [Oscillospiraceae bacterium]
MENQRPRIYTVATAHLDTSWHWPLEKTIEAYIPETLVENFALFEKYPGYTFSFEGAYRYALMEEYYPDLFAKLREYVAQGRWRVAGSSWENGDVNIPSPEALFRNILLGNNYFAQTFGKRSKDIYLPDCFGFGAALPGVAAHANLLGFTTQKLTWGSANAVPFGVGRWVAPDGQSIFAAPDAGNYTASLHKVRRQASMRFKLGYLRRHKLYPGALLLHGVGDQGGSPKEASVQTVCREMAANQTEKIEVLSAGSDQLFRDLAALPLAEQTALPSFKGEWLLCDHGTGCYTSRTWSKRWNRRAEQLADSAERMSCFAGILGRMEYPRAELNTAWRRVIAHHFHDDMTGTSGEISYVRNWNDLMVSQQQFAQVMQTGVSAVAGALDASFAVGRCAAVCNPTQWARAEALRVELPHRLRGSAVRVVDAEGREVPSQADADGEAVVFLAGLPPLSVSLFDLQISEQPCALETGLHVSENTLENKNIRATLDANGDIASLYDKRLEREILCAPVRLALFDFDGKWEYPQWELYYRELKRPAAEYPAQPSIRIVEQGAARVAIEIVRRARHSTFRQVISLDSASDTLRVANEIDWFALRSLCKVEVQSAAACKEATYDVGFGTVRRGNNQRDLYEVPAQQWADLSDAAQGFGLSILSDSKTGWDKPDDHTLRMTAVYSPRASRRSNAHLLDFGRNRFDFGLYPHAQDWRSGTAKAGAAFNQPLHAFLLQGSGVAGAPTALRFGGVSDGILLRCLKQAEEGREYIIRVQESYGSACPDGEITLGGGIANFREVYASEEPRLTPPGCAALQAGVLHLALEPYEIRTFAVLLLPILESAPQAAAQQAVALPCDCRVTSRQGEAVRTEFALPAERFPASLTAGGVAFALQAPGTANALRCKGQVLQLPAGRELRLLLASFAGERDVPFSVGGQKITRTVFAAREPVGHGDLPGIGRSGYVKAAAPALEFAHLHDAQGQDLIGAQALFFSLTLPLPGEAVALTLPQAGEVYILAATVCGEATALPGSPLFDLFPARPAAEMEPHLTPKQIKTAETRRRLRFVQNNLIIARRYLQVKRSVHLHW